jgi:hypothetical protein
MQVERSSAFSKKWQLRVIGISVEAADAGAVVAAVEEEEVATTVAIHTKVVAGVAAAATIDGVKVVILVMISGVRIARTAVEVVAVEVAAAVVAVEAAAAAMVEVAAAAAMVEVVAAAAATTTGGVTITAEVVEAGTATAGKYLTRISPLNVTRLQTHPYKTQEAHRPSFRGCNRLEIDIYHFLGNMVNSHG